MIETEGVKSKYHRSVKEKPEFWILVFLPGVWVTMRHQRKLNTHHGS
jgi:hypothetical protein